MAVVLPYPDMDFVPLDILTAAEQDQLVANIEYLAGLFPLNVSNIDLSTLNCITIYGASTGTVQVGQNGIIPFTSVKEVSGTGLSLSDNGILIGSGITKVLISANVFYDFESTTEYGWYKIKKNSTNITGDSIASLTGGYGSASSSPQIISVTAGDILRLNNNSDGAVIRQNSTWMTAIAI